MSILRHEDHRKILFSVWIANESFNIDLRTSESNKANDVINTQYGTTSSMEIATSDCTRWLRGSVERTRYKIQTFNKICCDQAFTHNATQWTRIARCA